MLKVVLIFWISCNDLGDIVSWLLHVSGTGMQVRSQKPSISGPKQTFSSSVREKRVGGRVAGGLSDLDRR